MIQKVVVIGHSYSSRLSIIRSVAQIGCEITVIVMTNYKHDGKTIDTEKPIDCYSKYVSHFYFCPRKDKEAFIRLLLEKCADPNQKVILIPVSDGAVSAIDNHFDALKDHFYFPHILNKPGAIEFWMDKSRQKEIARSVGLHVADARIVEIQDGVYTLPSDVKYPCYTKPLATMNGGKGGMRRCANASELAAAVDYFISHRNRTGKILVEDYKEITKEYALLGLSDGKNVTIPYILQLLVVSKQNKGIALQGKITSISGFEDIVDKFKELVKTIGLVGLFDIDFYESDNKLYFCELNMRFGGSGYAVTKMGVNLPAMYVQLLTNERQEMPSLKTSGDAIYVNERMCLDDWNAGCISYRQFTHFQETADIRFIPDEEDPMPEKAFKKTYKKRIVINTIKRIIGKY